MPNVDLVPAPAADAVTFRLRKFRLWLAMMLYITVSVLLARVTVTVVAAAVFQIPFQPARNPFPSYVPLLELVASPILGGMTAASVIILYFGRDLGWVRASSAGLEFANTGCRPVFLPWTAIAAVRVRYRGLFARLIVRPTSWDDAAIAPVRGRPPWYGRDGFRIGLFAMTPGRAALLAELQRRLAA